MAPTRLLVPRRESKTIIKRSKKMESPNDSQSERSKYFAPDYVQSTTEDESSQSQLEEEEEEASASASLIQKQVEGMSTHDLINNPNTLQAGLSLLNNHIMQATTALKNNKNKASPIVASSSQESFTANLLPIQPRAVLKLKVKSKGRKRSALDDDTEERIPKSSPCSSPCSTSSSVGSWCSTTTTTASTCSNSDAAAEDLVKKGGEKGVAQFGELCRRFTLPTEENSMSPAKKLDQFDLEKSDGIFLQSVFMDYDKKEKMFQKHSKKIEELDVSTALEYFEAIKNSILDIFEGRLQSERMELYLSDKKDDLSVLKGLCVSAPFSNPIYMFIANQITDFLLPKRRSKQKYLQVVQLVLIPEALTRIYASVNGIECVHAEKEMRYGPQYDGPVLKKRKGLKPSNRGEDRKKKTNKTETTDIPSTSTRTRNVRSGKNLDQGLR